MTNGRVAAGIAAAALLAFVSYAYAARSKWAEIYYYDASGGVVGGISYGCNNGPPLQWGQVTSVYTIEEGPCF